VAIRSKYLRLGEHRVHWLESGTGPDLVLWPSPLVMAATYRRLIKVLARRFRTLAIELPGSGFCSEPRRPLDQPALADVGLQALERIGVRRATWIAHSNSGPIAAAGALAHPDGVERLILSGSIGGVAGDSIPRLVRDRLIEALFELRVTLWAAPSVTWNLLRHPRSLFAQIRAAATTDLRPVVAALSVPVLLAWGENDRTEPLQAARALHAAAPNAELAILPGRHDWIIEHPEQLDRVIAGEYSGDVAA
jgi:pimeloyl-ACP methyl ester carboxylesterase